MPILLSHILQCSSEFIIPCQEQHVIIQLKCIEYTQVNADENRRFCPYFGRYWWAAPVINLDQGESSFMAVFSTRGAFFRNAGAKVQFFWAENKNMAKKLEKKSVSIWFIAIYIKLNFAFNIFGKTKVSLRVGDPLLMTPCRNHPAKWHSFRKNFFNSLSIWFSDSYHSKITQTDSIILY